jgi:hypothetical protein
MARRPQPPDEVLSRKELTELQRRLSMMHHRGSGFLSERVHGLPYRARTFPQCESDSGTGPGVEADKEVALTSFIAVGPWQKRRLGQRPMANDALEEIMANIFHWVKRLPLHSW